MPFLLEDKCYLRMVPMAGVEPARLSPLPPQDSVSTNSTTSAFFDYNYKATLLAPQQEHPALKQRVHS